MGFKELCKTAPPEQVAEAALHAFDGKPEQQGEWADKALAATTEPSLDPKQLQQISGALAELKATMEKPVAKAKDAPASRDDILARMVAASKPSAKDAASVRRYRIQAAKEEKRAKDRAALEKKKAFDRAVEADKLADQRKQFAIAAVDQQFYSAVRAPWDRKYAKDESCPELGEISTNPSSSFATQVQSEQTAQEKRTLQPPPRNGVRYASAYEDLGSDYQAAGRALRGEDAAPRNHEEKFDAEWRLAREKLERA